MLRHMTEANDLLASVFEDDVQSVLMPQLNFENVFSQRYRDIIIRIVDVIMYFQRFARVDHICDYIQSLC